jgi:hypothetical protein
VYFFYCDFGILLFILIGFAIFLGFTKTYQTQVFGKCVANVRFADLPKWLSNAKLLANGFAIHLPNLLSN